MAYVVEVQQNGQVVQSERAGSSAAAQAIADQWRRRGFSVVVKTETGGSTPYGGPPR